MKLLSIPRLEKRPCYNNLVVWMTKYFGYIKILPRHLIPKYFTRIHSIISHMVGFRIYNVQKLDEQIEVVQNNPFLIIRHIPFSRDSFMQHMLLLGMYLQQQLLENIRQRLLLDCLISVPAGQDVGAETHLFHSKEVFLFQECLRKQNLLSKCLLQL